MIELKLIPILFLSLIISPAILPVVDATFPLPSTGQWLSPVVINNYVYLLFNGHTIRAFNINTGVEDPTRSISISGLTGFPTGMIYVDNLIFVMTDTDNVYAFNLNGDRVDSRDFTLDADDNVGLFNTNSHIYALVEVASVPQEYKAYDLEGDRVPLLDITYPTESYNLTTVIFDGYLVYVNKDVSPSTVFTVSVINAASGTRHDNFTITPETNNARAGFLFGYETELLVLDNSASPNVIYDYVVPEQIDPVTTLTSQSHAYDQIDLFWEEPYYFPEAIISGYQINFTSPFGNPLDCAFGGVEEPENCNTRSTATSQPLEGFSATAQYSFRVSVISNTGQTNANGNILNTTTFNTLRLGNLDVEATNEELVNFKWEKSETGDTTTIVLDYTSTINDLQCYYDTKFNRAKVDLPVNPTLNGDRYFVQFQFLNATNDIVTITCKDPISGEVARYLIPQKTFLLTDLISSFRAGEYGTDGTFGTFDLVALTVVILAMIGFNRVNETVGIIMSIVIIGICGFFGIFRLEGLIISMVAVFIMLGIAQTRK